MLFGDPFFDQRHHINGFGQRDRTSGLTTDFALIGDAQCLNRVPLDHAPAAGLDDFDDGALMIPSPNEPGYFRSSDLDGYLSIVLAQGSRNALEGRLGAGEVSFDAALPPLGGGGIAA